MRIIGLDLSTYTGFAKMINGVLSEVGKVDTQGVLRDHQIPEYNSIYQARAIANRLVNHIVSFNPDMIVIEQTNLGKDRHDQKTLEFVHFAVLDMLEGLKMDNRVVYVDTSAWKTALGIKLSKEQRKHNSILSKAKKEAKLKGLQLKSSKKGQGKITSKHLSVAWVNEKFGLKLLLNENDTADAIALACYGDQRSQKITSQAQELDLSVFK